MSHVATTGQKDLPYVASEDVEESKGGVIQEVEHAKEGGRRCWEEHRAGFQGLFFATRVFFSDIMDF